MPARIIRLSELQPTDTLRSESYLYLAALETRRLREVGMPEVWETPSGLLISDGNQRTAVLAERGRKAVHVDLKKIRPEMAVFIEEQYEHVLARARELRER